MNIKDLPQGSYTVTKPAQDAGPKKLNIKDLDPSQYTVTMDASKMQPQTPAAQPQQPGLLSQVGSFVKNAARDFTKPIVQTAAAPGQLLGAALNPKQPVEDTTLNLPFYGKIEPPTTYGQSIGRGIQTATAAAGPVLSGAGYLGGQAIAQGKGLLDTAGSALEGAALGKAGEIGGKLLGAGLSKLGGFVKEIGGGVNALRESAAKDIAQVLSPTTKANKIITAKIAPQIAQQGITAFTRKGLLSKAEQQVENLGESGKLGEAWDKLPQEHQTALKPIIQKITDRQNAISIVGPEGKTFVPQVNQVEHNYLSTLKNEVVNLASEDNIPTRLLRQYKQTLDGAISKASKGEFGYSPNDKAILSAQKNVANTIRDEMAKAAPSIAKINNEFTFWKRMQDVLKATELRTQGQSGGLRQAIAKGAGIAAGFLKGGIPGAAEGGMVMQGLEKLMSSTAWKTMSAANKSKLADFLATNNLLGARKIIELGLQGVGTVADIAGKGIKKAVPVISRGAVTSLGDQNNQ